MSYESGEQSYFKASKGYYGVSDSIEFSSFFKFSFIFKNLKLGEKFHLTNATIQGCQFY